MEPQAPLRRMRRPVGCVAASIAVGALVLVPAAVAAPQQTPDPAPSAPKVAPDPVPSGPPTPPAISPPQAPTPPVISPPQPPTPPATGGQPILAQE